MGIRRRTASSPRTSPVPRVENEPRLRMAIAHADDETNDFLDRLYGGDEHRGPRNGMRAPWAGNDQVNPFDVLSTFLYAAHMGKERNLKAQSGL
jgi:hypothetical protein